MAFYIVPSMENKSLTARDERGALIEYLGVAVIASADETDKSCCPVL